MAAEVPAAIEVQRYLAFVSADNLPAWLLDGLGDQSDAAEAVAILARYGLVCANGSRLSVHRVVQDVTRWPLTVEAEAGYPSRWGDHQLRHFLFTWLKTQGIDDALIQPYSCHASRQSLEIYSRIALADAQKTYEQTIGHFPV